MSSRGPASSARGRSACAAKNRRPPCPASPPRPPVSPPCRLLFCPAQLLTTAAPAARSTAQPTLEALHPGPQLDLPGPGAALLAPDVQVGPRDLVRVERAVGAALARLLAKDGARIVRALADAAVDDEVRDVDAPGRELARHAL